MREWLIKKRSDKEIHITEVAKACDISKNYYGMIEAGKRNPSVAVAQKIAKLLDFEWTLFFSGETLVNGITNNPNPLVHGHK